MVLQESCLERRRSQLRALTELLASGPDPALVGQAVQAAQALPMLEYCADAQALTAAVPPPEDPALRARVEALQEQVDRQEALYEAGKYPAGLALGEALLKEAEALPYPPLQARVLYVLSELKEPGGAYEESKALAQRAILVAAQGKDSQLVARAWSQVLLILGSRQGRYEEALKLSLALETAVALSDDPLTRADADNTLGNALHYLDRFEEARQHHERALKIREKLLGSEHPAHHPVPLQPGPCAAGTGTLRGGEAGERACPGVAREGARTGTSLQRVHPYQPGPCTVRAGPLRGGPEGL